MASIESTDADILAEDELDFSDAGIQPQRAIFRITDVTREQLDNGVQALVTVATVDPSILAFPITLRHWLSHTNPNNKPKGRRPHDVGRGAMKALYRAVYGEPTGSFAGLRGQYYDGWLTEDKQGRATVLSPRTALDDDLNAALTAAGDLPEGTFE